MDAKRPAAGSMHSWQLPERWQPRELITGRKKRPRTGLGRLLEELLGHLASVWAQSDHFWKRSLLPVSTEGGEVQRAPNRGGPHRHCRYHRHLRHRRKPQVTHRTYSKIRFIRLPAITKGLPPTFCSVRPTVPRILRPAHRRGRARMLST
jgi:hypothetical protein